MNAPRRSHGAQPEYWEPVKPDIPALRSPARELVGNPAERDPDEPVDPDPPRPASLLLLDRYDQIMSLGVIEEPRRRRRLARVRYEHVMVCKWLDRFGFMTTEQLHRAVLPRRTLRATQDLLYRMRSAGLIERRHVQISIEEGRKRGGSGPRLYSLLPDGYRLGQRSPGFYRPVIPRTSARRRSEARTTMHLHHDLHAIGWWHAFEAMLGPGVGVSDVFTPRYEEGRFTAPRVHTGRGYRAAERRDILLGGGADIAGIPNDPFKYTVEPDLTIRLEVMDWLTGETQDLALDLLVEIDRTRKPAKNLDKLKRYDQFLAGWGLLHPRFKQLGTRPIAIFTSPDEASMLALMKVADEIMTGRIAGPASPSTPGTSPAATTSSSRPRLRSTTAPCSPGDCPKSHATYATSSATRASRSLSSRFCRRSWRARGLVARGYDQPVERAMVSARGVWWHLRRHDLALVRICRILC